MNLKFCTGATLEEMIHLIAYPLAVLVAVCIMRLHNILAHDMHCVGNGMYQKSRIVFAFQCDCNLLPLHTLLIVIALCYINTYICSASSLVHKSPCSCSMSTTSYLQKVTNGQRVQVIYNYMNSQGHLVAICK